MMMQNLINYLQLMRLHKPIGIFLLFWPTMWALWLASDGQPNLKIVLIFFIGVILMRSVGCVLNDFADRKFDPYVSRTKDRPLACGRISSQAALILSLVLVSCAFGLVLFCNFLTLQLACIGALLALIYPFLKRITHLPQVGLSLAFSWGVPMAFAAETDSVPLSAWVLFGTAAIWPMIYDTIYAIVDRQEDIKIGVKSTAILFDEMDKFIVGLLQTLFVVMLIMVGLMFRLEVWFYCCVALVPLFCLYQQWLIKDREPKKCLQAFTNNHWIGLIIFLGIFLDYQLPAEFWP